MQNQALLEFIETHKKKIDENIYAILDQKLLDVKEISDEISKNIVIMKQLAEGGKRLRGLLTILGYQIGGKKADPEIYKAAAVMELFHLGLLIQDDVMDQDEVRRGVKNIQTYYENRHTGEAVATCATDLTFGWAVETLSDLKLPNDTVLRAMKIWGRYFTRVGYGQMLDVLGDIRNDQGEKEILQVLHLKSGEYTCVLPLQLGAALSNGNDDLMKRLLAYGMELGWVFQLRDDWLSEYGNSLITGKPTGNDKREGRRSFAVVYGKDKTETEIMKHWGNGKILAEGNRVMEGLLEWMATREN